MPRDASHILINALSATAPGGFTVARNLAIHLGAARPSWRFILALIEGVPMHDQLPAEDLPGNVELLRAPASAALRRLPRARYESGELATMARQRGVDLVLQLNGIPPRGMDRAVFCHNQDPWPYRPQAWDMGWSDRLLALLRRRAQKRGLKRAETVGFTSNYLRDLMIDWQGVTPRRSGVYYNGLPQSWIDRAANVDALTPPWADRPMEILSVSAVGRYKRQELIIRALPKLIERPDCRDVIYRVIGQMTTEKYGQWLRKLTADLGVTDRVVFEGHATNQRVAEAYARARCFCLMSVCESFGVPAIEAMSFGAPVVTSDCCAMPEVCGSAAVLSPVDDLSALVDNLHRVLTDDTLASQLRAAGARNCARFRWSDTAEKMALEMEQVIKR